MTNARALSARARRLYRQAAGAPVPAPWPERRRLASLPRHVPGVAQLRGDAVRFVDAASFLSAYDAIFTRGTYDFEPSRADPSILDCGANIGLALLYWKRRWPAARIVAFEPDPVVFATLAANVRAWDLSGVELVEAAVWSSAGQLHFRADGADGGRVDVPGGSSPQDQVRSVRLRDHLDQPVDLLKLDVEGAEVEVLIDCSDRLHHVDHAFVEFHSYVGVEQRLDELLAAFRSAGMRVHLQPELVAERPFVEQLDDGGMDHRVNVFAWRDAVADPPREGRP